MAALPPNGAFVLLMGGILAVESEFVWPGKVIPGVLGALAGAAGAFCLLRFATPVGFALLGSGVMLGLLETFCKINFVAGILATAVMTAGFCVLLRPPETITLGLAIPMSVVVGAATVLLLNGAKRARRSKWSDLRQHE